MTQPLSREYLLSRGVCCGSGCKNCPYVPKNTRGSKIIKEVVDKIR